MKQPKQYPPLEQEARIAVDTDTAAFHLNRSPQTLRAWACKSGTGPIKPLHIHGRLLWRVDDLKQLLGIK